MKRVVSFKTSDGQLHENKVGALMHDYFLNVRGLIHRKVGVGNQNLTLTPTQVAALFKDNIEELHALTSKFRDSIRRNTKVKPEREEKI